MWEIINNARVVQCRDGSTRLGVLVDGKVHEIDNGGGVSSWNDLTDKPFYEEKAFEPIVWDGNTDGLENHSFTVSEDGATVTAGMYKVSDIFISHDDISLGTICSDRMYINANGEISDNTSESTFEKRKYDYSKEGDGWLFDPGNGGQIIMSDGTYVFMQDTPYEAILSRGLWFQKSENRTDDMEYLVYATAMRPDPNASVIKTLDEKYMPTLTSPSGKKFKLSVDDSGAVTATEV